MFNSILIVPVSDEQTLPYSSSISAKELFWLRLLSVCHRMADTDITNCPAVDELNIINPRFVFYISIGIYLPVSDELCHGGRTEIRLFSQN